MKTQFVTVRLPSFSTPPPEPKLPAESAEAVAGHDDVVEVQVGARVDKNLPRWRRRRCHR